LKMPTASGTGPVCARESRSSIGRRRYSRSSSALWATGKRRRIAEATLAAVTVKIDAAGASYRISPLLPLVVELLGAGSPFSQAVSAG